MPVFESDKMRERRDLTFTLERNILGVPTFVLHSKACEKFQVLKHTWTNSRGLMKYQFERTSQAPLPQMEHAKYFDALVGLFATRWNPEGNLWFSIAEVLRFAGKNPNNEGAKRAVRETIRRYQFCQASWVQSWDGQESTWVAPYIPESDIWDEVTGELKRNPRNSRKKTALHRIRFNEYVVRSLKDSRTRVFLTESLQKLKPDSYAVYRYFYGFSDQSKVKRDLEDLMRVFPWSGRKTRFQPWLEARLQDGLEKGFIESYEFKEGRVEVKCKSLKEHRDSAPVIELKATEPTKKKLKRKAKMKASKVTDEALLEEYYRRKQDGVLENETIQAVEMMFAAGLKDPAMAALRNRLAKRDS